MTSLSSDRPSGQTPPTAPSPATPAPSLRELAERVLTTGGSLRALRATRIGGTTKEFHTADMEARHTFNQAFDAFSEAATPAAIIALSDELESTRSALREARLIGTMMSNLCYNLAQQSGQPLSQPTCELMDEMRRKWDAAAGSTTP